jgi:hypothetical protein
VSDLKRIEEKHAIRCHRCFDPERPCDVVKLARALEVTLAALIGGDPEGVESVYDEGRRVLREVAGGDDE